MLMQMHQKETTICRLCLEPVTNYICSVCLFENVQVWLIQSNRTDLLEVVFSLNERIKQMIQQDENGAVCVVCKNEMYAVACPCCYLFEIYSLLRAVSLDLSNRFEKHFNFDFNHHHGYSQLAFLQNLRGRLLAKNFEPIVITDKRQKHDVNICDSCDQYAEDLMEHNGWWLCETCRESG